MDELDKVTKTPNYASMTIIGTGKGEQNPREKKIIKNQTKQKISI